MISDKYVIVYRDGSHGKALRRDGSDMWLHFLRGGSNPPAYRIRIKRRVWDFTKFGADARYAPESTYRPDPFNNLPDMGRILTWGR